MSPIDIDPVTGAPIYTPPDFSPPTSPEEPPVTVVTPLTPEQLAEEKSREKDLCLVKATELLNEAGGLESNLGLNSPYWDYMNLYRSL